jgi:hypothetical protein
VSGVNRNRLILGLVLLLLLVGSLWFFADAREVPPKRRIAMMSSIPLQWGEADVADVVKGEAQGALVFEQVSAQGIVTMIDRIGQLRSARPDLLILVQPRMLEPQELAELDRWVRIGGRAIIFADPALQWPSRYPLGDSRRPLFTSFLSPLFKHWGIELVMPVSNETEQVSSVNVGGQNLDVVSQGNWIGSAKTGPCRIEPSSLIAVCKPGKGRVVLIADADMLEDAQLANGIFQSENAPWLHKLIESQIGNTALPQGL